MRQRRLFTDPPTSTIIVARSPGGPWRSTVGCNSHQGLSGTSTPYDVPFALAWFKLPLEALTALGGLIALQGDFVPGLSELASQGQILAYALVFGYAQQLLSGMLDRRAQTLLDSAPGKEKEARYTQRSVTTAPAPPPPGPGVVTETVRDVNVTQHHGRLTLQCHGDVSMLSVTYREGR